MQNLALNKCKYLCKIKYLRKKILSTMFRGMRTPDFKKRSKVVKMICPMPLDVRAWLEQQAAFDLAPMTSVVIRALRVQMAAERHQERALSETTD